MRDSQHVLNIDGLESWLQEQENSLTTVEEEKIPLVEVSGVNYAYGKGDSRVQVLFNNDLTIYSGEIVIMTGPSGSGKTTLLTLVGALRSMQEGNLKVLGRGCRACDQPSRLT